MIVHTVIPCVHYDDYLRLTLAHNLAKLPHITILTAPDDLATVELAEEVGVEVFITPAWYDGGPLNKGLALNEWLSARQALDENEWLMVLDADILFPPDCILPIDNLDPKQLYSIRRRMCWDLDQFVKYLRGDLDLTQFPTYVPRIIDGKVWGHRPTSNPAALSGYLQLWCPRHSVGHSLFAPTGTAADYDVEFGLSFPEDMRSYIPDCDVLHLGPIGTNWSGRRSPLWSLQQIP